MVKKGGEGALSTKSTLAALLLIAKLGDGEGTLTLWYAAKLSYVSKLPA